MSYCSHSGKLRRSEKGQALVEAALVLPLLLLLLFTIMDFSYLFFVYQSMENGVSQATRYGITGQQKPDPENAGYNLSIPDSMKLIMRENNSFIVLNDSDFKFEYLDLEGAAWYPGIGGPGKIYRMTVNYKYEFITPLLGRLFTGGGINLRVSSTMKSEGYPTS
jgi:hypothetical protein